MTISHLIRQTAQTHYHHYTYRSYEGFFPPLLPLCALFIMLHERTFFSAAHMRGSWMFHVEHGAAPAGSFVSEHEVGWRHHSTTLFLNELAAVVTHRHKHKDTWNSSHTCPHCRKKCGTYSLLAQGWYNDQLNKEKSKLLLPEVMINKEREREERTPMIQYGNCTASKGITTVIVKMMVKI